MMLMFYHTTHIHNTRKLMVYIFLCASYLSVIYFNNQQSVCRFWPLFGTVSYEITLLHSEAFFFFDGFPPKSVI
ncbi:unnamed protein product [Citrullus colocynthis]|uniref:Uncharacterized protein n=1 Tax=Citrullus colocynthis TaxID=252529 RepID=A0ABP0Z0Z2_9ROSI